MIHFRAISNFAVIFTRGEKYFNMDEKYGIY